MFVNSDFSDLLRIFRNNRVSGVVQCGFLVSTFAKAA
jgi:hypothetical protein